MDCLVAFLPAIVNAWLSHLFDSDPGCSLVKLYWELQRARTGHLWSRILLYAQNSEAVTFSVKAQEMLTPWHSLLVKLLLLPVELPGHRVGSKIPFCGCLKSVC